MLYNYLIETGTKQVLTTTKREAVQTMNTWFAFMDQGMINIYKGTFERGEPNVAHGIYTEIARKEK